MPKTTVKTVTKTNTYRRHVNGAFKIAPMTHVAGHNLPQFLNALGDVMDAYGVSMNAGTKFALINPDGSTVDVVLTFDQTNLTGSIMREIASRHGQQQALKNGS